jgi:hypothetical protein
MPQGLLAVVGLAFTVKGALDSQKASKKAEMNQKRLLESKQRQDQLNQQRERSRLIREARIKRGQALQSATNQGAGTGSGIAGGMGSIQSQLSNSLSFLDTAQSFSREQSLFQSNIVGAQGQQNTANALFGAGLTVFKGAGGFGAFKSVFSKDTPADGETNNV